MVNLHAYSSASISGVCQTCSIENSGFFDVGWYDTITVAGLASGTPVELLITAALDSSINAPSGASYAYSQFQLSSSQVQAANIGGTSNGLISQSVAVDTASGATLSLIATLLGEAVVNNLTQSESASVDASDTADFYITVLTPGATYTSASGLDYTAPVPEPASLGLTGGAILAIWVAIQKRAR